MDSRGKFRLPSHSQLPRDEVAQVPTMPDIHNYCKNGRDPEPPKRGPLRATLNLAIAANLQYCIEFSHS